MGTSTRPVLLILPTREKILVPLLVLRADCVNQSAPLLMISGTLAQVSTLLRTVGLAPEADDVGADVLGPGLSRPAFDRGHQGGRFAADKGASAPVYLDDEVEAGPQDVLPQEAAFLPPVLMAMLTFSTAGGILADVDVALVGADGIGPDGQALEDRSGGCLREGSCPCRRRGRPRPR